MPHLLLECTDLEGSGLCIFLRHCCDIVCDRIVEITNRAVRFAGNLVHTDTYFPVRIYNVDHAVTCTFF